MESSCVRQTLIPGTSKLLGDYLYHFDKVESFYPGYFGSDDAFRKAAAEIQFPSDRRQALIDSLREYNTDEAALEKLARPETVAVVTGQQVGLYSGPLYTIYKALTAVKLAHRMDELGIPAVPVFWLATEDHDLAEVDHTWVFKADGSPLRLHWTHPESQGEPVGLVPLGDLPERELASALEGFPFAPDVLEALRRSYKPGATLGGAFREFVSNLLHGMGLLYVDPLQPSTRKIAAPFLSQVVHRVPELVDRLTKRQKELEEAGYHAQVHIEQDASLLFRLHAGRRQALRLKDGNFASKDKQFTAAELQAEAESLSPNALLRPVMQDYLLPTISYIGGPSEIAYFAQAEVLYRALLGRMPVIFPRNSVTLLDTRSVKIIEHYHVRPNDIFTPPEHLKNHIAATLVPQTLQSTIQAIRSSLATEIVHLEEHLTGFDPTLKAAAQKSKGKMLYQLDKLSRKTELEALRRDARATRDAEYLHNQVYPHRHPQERYYSVLSFLAKYGIDLPQRLLNDVQLCCPDHMLRPI